jgi:tetratricopeptide (TPR) repeat protein
LYEALLHDAEGHEPSSPYQSRAGDAARAFAWDHALLAEAIAASGDTIRLHALADSIESIGARSYYGRDWRLHHHVRGLIAERGGRLREAIREFDAARWGSAGWTVTVAHMARAHIALGEPDSAIALLREAYKSSPDAMGRYLPRSELDLLMAEAFSRAGMRDSSARYAGYVRSAWADADPEVKSLLGALGGS